MNKRFGDPALAGKLAQRLAIPVVAAPMFLVSGPELVIASSRAGVIGSFPTLNARTIGLLERWLVQIIDTLVETKGAAPFAANLIVHPTNSRLAEDLDLIVRYRVPIVIASVGSPTPVVEAVKSYGGLVLSDVASLKHARRAVAAGVDGLILLCAGAGGNTGWLNPFAFVGAVRDFFVGPIALAGAISRGKFVHIARQLGADFAYVGTSFIATRESMASEAYRSLLIASSADDIILTSAVTGIPANMLRGSLERAGIAPLAKDAGGFTLMKELETLTAWRDIWSAGHGVGDVTAVETVQDVVGRLRSDYDQARTATSS
jgi:nitronate monooxygenase